MSGMAKAIGGMFSGRDQRIAQINANIAAEQQKQQAQVQQERVLQQEQQDVSGQLAKSKRAPRGRRLLMYAGEEGVSSTLG